MSVKDNIQTLGIPQKVKCPHCGRTESLDVLRRRDLAESMMSNSNGLWALLHCGWCGYVRQIYPTRINGIACTKKECMELFEEIKRYDLKEREE